MSAAADMDKKQVVEHILRHRKNYFNLLQVSKTATKAEVSAAYKKLALKCHPDKNEHPQAAEAFKILGSARDVLSDPEVRSTYVRRGDDGVRQHESGMRQRAGPGARGAPQDPFEEFFTFFSSGGFFQQENNPRGGARAYYYTNSRGPNGGAGFQRAGQQDRQTGAGQQQQQQSSSFFLFLPLLMFLVMVMLLQSGWETVNPSSYQERGRGARSGERTFSLTPMPELGLVVRQTTSLFNTNVEYYTSHKNLNGSRERRLHMEREVLREKKNSLNRRCEADTFNHRARGTNDVPSSCEEYRRLAEALG
eukprot:gene5138-3689_t